MALGKEQIDKAAGILADAWKSGARLDALPADCAPGNLDDAHLVQEAVIAKLGQSVEGWKASIGKDGRVIRGALLGARVFASPAKVKASLVPMAAAECEIAFRFDRDLPARDTPYTRDEVLAAVTALAVIEIVDTRFKDFKTAEGFSKTADCASNGGFVKGGSSADWRKLDLTQLDASITLDGVEVAHKVGGHPLGDPLAPAVALANDSRSFGGIKAGRIVTTGSLTGVTYMKPGQHAVASVKGLGTAELTLE